MATLRFFEPNGDRGLVYDMSNDLITMSYSEQPYGSLDGEAQIEVTDDNREFLRGLNEYSHYLKLSSGDLGLTGGLVKNCYLDKGIAHIKVEGFLEYMDSVPMIASQKATALTEATVVDKEDPSWAKTIYADSNAGVFFGIFRNLTETMVAQGYTPFFELQGIEELMALSPDGEWDKSYRINTLEIPNVAQIYSDLVDDSEFLAVKVVVDDSDTFKWFLQGFSSYNLVTINTATDPVKDVSIDRGDRISRTIALASGTDPLDDNLISSISFNPDAAYSAAFNEDASKNVLNITRASRAAIAGANRRTDQISFTTWSPDIEIYSAVTVSGPQLSPVNAVVTEKATDGRAITYTAIVVDDFSSLIPGVGKPTNEARRMIFNPAKSGARRSAKISLQKANPTGWR